MSACNQAGDVPAAGRREAIKLLIGSSVALGVGAVTTPLAALLSFHRADVVKSGYASVEVVLCESVDNCPDQYSVPISELEQGPKFVLLQKGSLAIPAVFGLVRATDGKLYPAAYNIVCTHFGCPVNPLGGPYLSGFGCPCHGAVYQICADPKGCPNGASFLEAAVVAGPAPRALRPIKVAVKGDRVYALRAYI
ncbi:MAG: ubiquinol-cytochrome c reductase iron-sulfur subunit [Thermoproteus sp.]|jgi:ubiquinol-cytochrome c reductase iron-sulfur subunit/cytochrome b6-f complex iron-sulfur subunit